MSNLDQEHFYYVDPGIGEKRPGCPYTLYQDGRDVKSFIVPPKGYELTGFKLVPLEADKFYDGKIVAQFEKVPFSAPFIKEPKKYLLTFLSFASVLAVLVFFFTNGKSKMSPQHAMNPKTDIATLLEDTLVIEEDTEDSTIADNFSIEETTATKEEVVKEEALQEVVPPTENSVEPNDNGNDKVNKTPQELNKTPQELNKTPQELNVESKAKQEPAPSTLLTKEQFHQELWELIHRKERHMRTYKDLYNKYKGLHLKNKEFFYLYLTILENTSGFENWKSKLVSIPDDELKSINTINALKQKLEEYE